MTRRTLTIKSDETERLIYIGLRCIGSIKTEGMAWAAYDQDGTLIGMCPDDKAASAAVFTSWARREEGGT